MMRMTTNTLQVLSHTLSIYLNVQYPKSDTSWRSGSLAITLFDLYNRLVGEIEEVEAKLIRHFVEAPVEDGDENVMVMSMERVGAKSTFELRCNNMFITSWTEKEIELEN